MIVKKERDSIDQDEKIYQQSLSIWIRERHVISGNVVNSMDKCCADFDSIVDNLRNVCMRVCMNMKSSIALFFV